ncbi:hypothetical protein RUND412_010297 [Rhizina undulata]
MHTTESIIAELTHDDKVKLAGVDIDGVLRGKLISKKKFLSVLDSGFGFCSVVFGWDMHDRMYSRELSVSTSENGFRDILAKIDIQSFRRIPWEEASYDGSGNPAGVPFFLVSFFDPDTQAPIDACPRGLLQRVVGKVEERGWKAMAGAEYEFFNYRENPNSLAEKGARLEPLTPGMFGYSISRPIINQDFYYGIFDACKKFNVDLEGWHTETGPGVYEAALQYGEIREMADKASLFKYVVKALGLKHNITPCFMAKPREGLPGNSGHIHISLVDTKTGQNLFARDSPDPNPKYPDLAHLSTTGYHFLAGLLAGLPSIMPLLAPTINSYKRLVENFWAPVAVSWGLEHRSASIRLIAPPSASPSATRFEVRTCGADANPQLALAGILALGMYGIENKLEITIPPLGAGAGAGKRLPRNLAAAVEKMRGGLAEEVLGAGFVQHFAGTREHEWRLWEEAVTDWEVKRYIETV